MVVSDILSVSATCVLCPLLLAVAIVDFLPNPARYIMRRMVAYTRLTSEPAPPKTRVVQLAVDEKSHEAFEWALTSFLSGSTDQVYLIYVPQGDFARSSYKYPMHFDRYSYMDVLEGVDFLWEYCQRLDILNIEFECFVVPQLPGKDIADTILSKAQTIRPDIILMGASKRTGPEDVGLTASKVSLQSPVPVVVVK